MSKMPVPGPTLLALSSVMTWNHATQEIISVGPGTRTGTGTLRTPILPVRSPRLPPLTLSGPKGKET